MTPRDVTLTSRETSDLIGQRETALRLLPEGEVKKRVRSELVWLRKHAEALRAVTGALPVDDRPGDTSDR